MWKGATFLLALYAVFGWPIGHSLSPRIHNAAFAEEKLQAHYFPVEVRPAGLIQALDNFRRLGGVGVNLTRPLKETVICFLDQLSPIALAAKAANTIVWREGEWSGDNTDVRALAFALKTLVRPRKGARALIIGGGGVARGSAVALHSLDIPVWVASRRPVDFAEQWMAFDDLRAAPDFDVVINATPLGQVGEANWPARPRLIPGQTVVVDWVYHPRETALLQWAKEDSCPTVDGLHLLIEQARWSWQLWFDRMAPAQSMWNAVLGL